MAKTDTKHIGDATRHAASAVTTLDPLFQASNRLIEAWMAVGNELLEFGKSRIDRSLEMSRALAQTTSLDEAIDVQAKFTRSTMQDYFSEANKLADLGTRSLLESISPLQNKVHEMAERAEAAE